MEWGDGSAIFPIQMSVSGVCPPGIRILRITLSPSSKWRRWWVHTSLKSFTTRSWFRMPSRFQFYLAPPIAPAFGSREGFFGAPGSSYRRLPMHHKCWWVRRNSWPSEAARELLVRMPSKALMPSSSNFGLARRTMVSPDWFGM